MPSPQIEPQFPSFRFTTDDGSSLREQAGAGDWRDKYAQANWSDGAVNLRFAMEGASHRKMLQYGVVADWETVFDEARIVALAMKANGFANEEQWLSVWMNPKTLLWRSGDLALSKELDKSKATPFSALAALIYAAAKRSAQGDASLEPELERVARDKSFDASATLLLPFANKNGVSACSAMELAIAFGRLDWAAAWLQADHSLLAKGPWAALANVVDPDVISPERMQIFASALEAAHLRALVNETAASAQEKNPDPDGAPRAPAQTKRL